MKYLTKLLTFLILALGLIQCDYERIELVDECPDPTNPACPCPNPSNPACPVTFNNLLSNAYVGCGSDLWARDIIELNNDAGYIIVGQCDNKALILHIDNKAELVVCMSKQELEPNKNFFSSIARTSANRLVATGFAKNDGTFNTNAFNFLIDGSDCLSGDDFSLDGSLFQKWEQGNVILRDGSNIVVGGKWGAMPSITRLLGQSNMGNSGIEQQLILDSMFFEDAQGVTIASVNNYPNFVTPGHEILGLVKTGDGGFLGTGFVDARNGNGDFVRKAFVVKTKSDLEDPGTVTLEMLDDNLPFDNTTGYEVLEVNNGQNFIIAGLGHNGDIPQLLSSAGFPDDYPRDAFDGFIALTGNDLSFISHVNWVNNSNEDYILTATDTGNGSFLVSGIDAVNSPTHKITVKEFSAASGSLQESSNINIEYTETGKRLTVTKVIKTNDGGYLVLSNQSGDGIRIIKTDDQGQF